MEADLIRRFFVGLGAPRGDVVLGIGDDAALLAPPAGQQLVVTTDSLVENVHFLPQADAGSLGHRALAVNLSDLAAMGAQPAWALLSLNLPRVDENWLGRFAQGFGALLRAHGMALVGGNLSRGPLSVTVQVAGFVPPGQALLRSGAHPGDHVYVSGTPGDAGAALALLLAGRAAEAQPLLPRFEYPQPRVALGLALRGLASACIDLSDGLYADLGRLCVASGCSARIDAACLPISDALQALQPGEAWRQVLAGGEDYELCFTVPAAQRALLQQRLEKLAVSCRAIGVLQAGHTVEVVQHGSVIPFTSGGFDHFAGAG